MIMTNDMKTQTSNTPRVYAACLAAYNNGTLHGAWIDCDQPADGIREAVEAMLKASPEPGAEEWAFHDHENWYGMEPHESEDISTLAEWAEILVEHGEAYGVYAANIGPKYATPEQFEESYVGEIKSEKEFAEDEYFEVHGEGVLFGVGLDYNCIDWDYMAKRFFQYGDYWSGKGDSGTLYAFKNI